MIEMDEKQGGGDSFRNILNQDLTILKHLHSIKKVA